MKIEFSKSIAYTPKWNDNLKLADADQLKATLTPMPLGVLLSCTEALSQNNVTKDELTTDGINKSNVEKMRGSIDAIAEYLPKYVELQGAEGFTIQDVVGYARFGGLANELIGQLVTISSPNATDVKN